MRKPNSRKLSLMGRRRFLESLTKLGVSATAAGSLTKEELLKLTDDPSKEVPRLEGYVGDGVDANGVPQKKPIYYTIPRDEWERTEGLFNAGRRVSRDLERKGLSANSIGVTVKRTSDRHNSREISVQHITTRSEDGDVTPDISYEELKEAVPHKASGTAGSEDNVAVDDVPVTTEEVVVVPQNYSHKYRPLPAGVETQSVGKIFSGGTPAYDHDYNSEVYVTAAHNVDNTIGKKVYQLTDYIGKVQKSKEENYLNRFDAATISLENVDTEKRFGENGGGYSSENIVGSLSIEGLQDKEASGETMHKRGIVTGHTQGKVTNVSVWRDFFETDADNENGDSGGPHYTDGSSVLISGIHRGKRLFPSRSRATIMWSIQDEFNIDVLAL